MEAEDADGVLLGMLAEDGDMTGDLIRKLDEEGAFDKRSALLNRLAGEGGAAVGDRITRLMRQAEADEEAWLNAQKDERQPFTMQAVSDAAMRAIPLYARAMATGEPIPESAADQRRPVDRLRMNFDIALVQFRERLGGNLEAANARINSGLDAVDKGRPYCESYIEELILPWLVFEDYGQISDAPVPVHIPKADDLPPVHPLIIVPQFAFARYRMDFALVARAKAGMKIVCVECDGASFHDRHKDMLRDAYLAEWGIPTVRITPKELREYPRRASQRCARMISDLVG